MLGPSSGRKPKTQRNYTDELKKPHDMSLSTNKSNWRCLPKKTHAHLVTSNQQILASTKFLWSNQPKADSYLTNHPKGQCCKTRKPSSNNTPHTAGHALALLVLGHTEKGLQCQNFPLQKNSSAVLLRPVSNTTIPQRYYQKQSSIYSTIKHI